MTSVLEYTHRGSEVLWSAAVPQSFVHSPFPPLYSPLMSALTEEVGSVLLPGNSSAPLLSWVHTTRPDGRLMWAPSSQGYPETLAFWQDKVEGLSSAHRLERSRGAVFQTSLYYVPSKIFKRYRKDVKRFLHKIETIYETIAWLCCL